MHSPQKLKAVSEVTLSPTFQRVTPSPTSVTVPQNYKPTEKEPYMNPVMQEYFRRKLVAWKAEIIREADITLHDRQDEGGMQEPDIADRASAETEVALELRTRDRQRKLISKIDEALERLTRNEYGYCEETGDPIGVKRLEARPIATLTVEAQERHERRERTQRDERE